MEELVEEQRVRAVAIGAQRLHELRQPEMQALEMIRAAFRGLDVHVMTGRTTDVADPLLAGIRVEYRHLAGRVREDGAANVL